MSTGFLFFSTSAIEVLSKTQDVRRILSYTWYCGVKLWLIPCHPFSMWGKYSRWNTGKVRKRVTLRDMCARVLPRDEPVIRMCSYGIRGNSEVWFMYVLCWKKKYCIAMDPNPIDSGHIRFLLYILSPYDISDTCRCYCYTSIAATVVSFTMWPQAVRDLKN